LTKINLIDTFI